MKRIYISGKITGIEAVAPQLFAEAEQIIAAGGNIPVNPMKLNHNHDGSWHNYMRVDIREMCRCDAIYMLPNWKESNGAIIEFHLALHLGLDIIFSSKLNFTLWQNI